MAIAMSMKGPVISIRVILAVAMVAEVEIDPGAQP